MSSRIVRSQRDWLLERLIVEAGDYGRADAQIRQMRLGRVDGYLGVGVAFGFWSRRSADIMYDTILHGQAWPARLRRMAR
jgi:hypothetical protein